MLLWIAKYAISITRVAPETNIVIIIIEKRVGASNVPEIHKNTHKYQRSYQVEYLIKLN